MPDTIERATEILEHLGQLTEGTLFEDLDDFLKEYLSSKENQTVGALQTAAAYCEEVFRTDRDSPAMRKIKKNGGIQAFYDSVVRQGNFFWGKEPRQWIVQVMVSRDLEASRILELYNGYIFLLNLVMEKSIWEWRDNA